MVINGYNLLNIIFVAVGYPIIWYTVLSNHSWQHEWMTYRELSILVCGMMLFFEMVVLLVADKFFSEKKIGK